jgi:hypothetical protein
LPISLVSLAAAGLGWAVLLAFTTRRAMLAGLAAGGGASREAIDAMAQALIGQMQGTCTELQRADELLGHAIEQLIASFHQLGGPAGANPFDAGGVSGAVTALQFRDVVGQKLGHVRAGLLELEQVLHGIREVSGRCEHADRAADVGRLLRRLQHARAASPAQQELMHAGEVQLF